MAVIPPVTVPVTVSLQTVESKLLAKWGKAFWVDTAERVIATLFAAALGVIVAHTINVLTLTPAQTWTLLGAPTLTVLVKCLVSNLSGLDPTASMVNVSSAPGPLPSKAQIEKAAQAALTAAKDALDTSPPPQ